MKKIITIVLVYLSLQMSAQCWQNISAGENHSLGIKSDGTLWAWGNNGTGQLGDNTNVSKNVPTQIGTSNNWAQISAGHTLSLALKSDGTLWAWGWNSDGQLGIGSNVDYVNVPTQVGTATDWKSIEAGTMSASAIKNDGTLWTWGYNDSGQLGDNTLISKNVPTQVGSATNWLSVSMGAGHILAMKTDGTLWAWGMNSGGELGDGTSTDKHVPTQVGTAANWQSMDAGNHFSTAIKTDGTLWTWGMNSYGELGNGTHSIKRTPTQIGTDTDWLSVSGGFHYAYATKTDHSLWSWGHNVFGQMGNGTSGAPDVVVPTRVGLTSDTSVVSAGADGVLEKNNVGNLRACGRNYYGELGDGTNIQRNTFTPIACPTSTLRVEEASTQTDNLKVFPNPVQDILTVSFDQKILSVTVYNMAGQQVLTKAINDTEGTVDFSALISGVYQVKVNTTNKTTAKTVKVIKR